MNAPKKSASPLPMGLRRSQSLGWLATLLFGLRFADLLIVAGTGVLAYWCRHGFAPIPSREAMTIVFAVMLCLAIFNLGQTYSLRSAANVWSSSGRILGFWFLIVLLLLASAFTLKISQSFSRIWAGVWLVLASMGLIAARIVVASLIAQARRRGQLALRVAIIGADEIAVRLLRHLEKHGGDIQVIGMFDDRTDRLPEAASREGVRILGRIADIVPWTRENPVDSIIVAMPWSGERRLGDIIDTLQNLPVDVQVCPEGLGFTFDRFPIFRNSIATTLGGLPMFTVIKRPLDGWNWLVKRVEDVILVILLSPILLPLCLLIALAIKIDDPGPVLFLQQRAGFNGYNFRVMKFRTMRADAAQPEGNTDAATRDDPRVTRLGYFLRRTSLDELPQFLNVLKGDMSVVGPRPHALSHDQQFAVVIQQYYARQRVRPGITGWAQINGFRGGIEDEEDIRNRVDHDLWYIENWSILLDLRILLMTPFVGLINRNAY